MEPLVNRELETDTTELLVERGLQIGAHVAADVGGVFVEFAECRIDCGVEELIFVDAFDIRRRDERLHFAEAAAGRGLLTGRIGSEAGEADHDEQDEIAFGHLLNIRRPGEMGPRRLSGTPRFSTDEAVWRGCGAVPTIRQPVPRHARWRQRPMPASTCWHRTPRKQFHGQPPQAFQPFGSGFRLDGGSQAARRARAFRHDPLRRLLGDSEGAVGD